MFKVDEMCTRLKDKSYLWRNLSRGRSSRDYQLMKLCADVKKLHQEPDDAKSEMADSVGGCC